MAAAGMFALLAGSVRGEYAASNSYDLNGTFTQSFSRGAPLSGRQAGYATGTATGSVKHAGVWTGSSASFTDLHPSGYTESYILGTSASQYVGAGYGPTTAVTDHAFLWVGNTASVVDLNPTGYNQSYANATTGTQQVGYGQGTATTNFFHALLWSGTSASFVDLHPTAGFDQSYAFGINGTYQVGWGTKPKVQGNTYQHALVWTGTAASALDLHPASGFNETYTFGVVDNKPFGLGWGSGTSNTNHALVWTVTSPTTSTYVDIHPTSGFANSQIRASNGTLYVGYGGPTSGSTNEHAILWSTASAGAATDLHSLLPGTPTKSRALGVDVYGNITGEATYSTNIWHAVAWMAGNTYKTFGGTGTWNTASNWLSGAVPATGNDVQLIQSDTSNRVITYANASPSTTLGRLIVDATGTGTMQLSQTQDTLNTANVYVGFAGTGSVAQSGGTHNISGTLRLGERAGSSGAYALSGTGTLSANAMTIGSTSSFTQSGGSLSASSIVNTGTLTLAGTATTGTLDAATSGTTSAALTAAGVTSVSPNAAVTVSRIRQSSLSLQGSAGNATGTVTINETSPGASTGTPSGDDAMVSIVRSLLIDNSAGTYFSTLDVKNNDMIIDYTGGSSPLAAVEAMVKSGYNGGNWLGKGITSSIAAANSGSYSVVVLDNALRPTPFTTFDGITIPTTAVILKFSWVADLDLDGVVTSNDAIVFANNYAEGASASHRVGDLNCNGVFDSNDAILFANAYNESLPHLPEPASLGVMAMGAAGLLVRRRR